MDRPVLCGLAAGSVLLTNKLIIAGGSRLPRGSAAARPAFTRSSLYRWRSYYSRACSGQARMFMHSQRSE